MKLILPCAFFVFLWCEVAAEDIKKTVPPNSHYILLNTPDEQQYGAKRVYEVTTDPGYVLTATINTNVKCQETNSITFEDESGLFIGNFCDDGTHTPEVVISGSKMKITVDIEGNSKADFDIQLASDVSPSCAQSGSAQVNMDCDCGTKPFRPKSRIVGGEQAAPGDIPWQALIQWRQENVLCGATLISKNYVLTAAHCMQQNDITEYLILLGTEDTMNYTNAFHVESVKIHEKYDSSNQYHDIALMRLSREVTFTDRIRPICLPRNLKCSDFSGKTLTVSGWGVDRQEGRKRQYLQKTSVEGKTYLDCTKKETDVIYNQLCAHGENTDACQGDSGGPLTYEDIDNSIHYLAGLVSLGEGCADPNHYGIYTRVSGYLEWIDENTRGGKICSK